MTDRPLTLYQIADLRGLCADRIEESAFLEFKSCSELVIGSSFHDNKAKCNRNRTRDDVVGELSKDVSAFLNSGGGTIIYGIREPKEQSRADALDHDSAFCIGTRERDVRPERVVEWLRSHIQPPPSVHVYSVLENPSAPDSPWYLVVDVPQGEVAYMAADHRFYRRSGPTVKPMEQYEVADVMNRTRGAALAARMELTAPQDDARGWTDIRLRIAITSTNHVASEYGAVRLTFAWPVLLGRKTNLGVWPGARFDLQATLDIGDFEPIRAQSISTRWGANLGNVIFPGDQFDFWDRTIGIRVPRRTALTTLCVPFRLDLYTTNAYPRTSLYTISWQNSASGYVVMEVDEATRARIRDHYQMHSTWVVPTNYEQDL